MRNSRWRALAVGLVALAVAAGVARPATADQPLFKSFDESRMDTSRATRTEILLDENTATALDYRLRETAPQQFGGLYLDLNTGSAVVFWKGDQDLPGVDSVAFVVESARSIPEMPAPEGLAHGYQLVVHAAEHSLVELDQERDSVVSGDWTPDVSDRVATYFVDVSDATVHVGLEKLSDADRENAARVFGSAVVLFADERGEKLGTRSADAAPHYGGLRLYNSSGSGCSGGFDVKNAASDYMLTAGHCGSSTFTNNGAVVGSTVGREFLNNGYDSQYISGQFSPRIYSGCLTCSTNRIVKGTWAPWIGEADILISGATSGQAGFFSISQIDVCHDYGSITTCHLDAAGWVGPMANTAGGDSGGAVYVESGANAYAVGTVDGVSGTGTMYFSRIQALLSRWGLTLVTG